ncbi:chromosome segregation protein SMC [Frateuria aurantia]
MRLSTIKLAGFKSFVDPTTLQLPTNMTGVVGPNGCGKSNIIDAIRWVMGESAASRLRGDSLTDVIFSGSNARKPVGQATVELVFDNSDGGIQGEYGQYAEISVKRLVSRDGQSAYFLNGTRCRRRDITDLFLGTGLGPRSYSIIEQGMISQIVEARPEDLRVHLEEAAGISKYKDRRKETESRIRATRENMERVADVRNEVDKQLEHLNRQARAAERWTVLKEEQARKEAELRALEYRHVKHLHEQELAGVRGAEVEIERVLAGQRELEAQLETVRERQIGASDHLGEAQAAVYQVGAEIARVEQQIRFHRETAERLQRGRAEIDQEVQGLNQHLGTDRQQLQQLDRQIEEGEPRLETLQALQDDSSEALQAAEQALADWQQGWEQYNRVAGEASRSSEVERTRLNLLDRQSMDVARRGETLAQELAGTDPEALANQLETLELSAEVQRGQVEALGEQVESDKQVVDALAEDERGLQLQLDALRQQLQQARGRHGSLEALQAAALGQDENPASAWLAQAGLSTAPRLGARLEVAPGWDTAVETVLGGWLDAVLVEQPEAWLPSLGELVEADLILAADREAGPAIDATLAAVARAPAGVAAVLARVRTAATLEQAQAMLASLEAGESVITPDGCWLSRDWAQVRRGQGHGFGVLSRERELKTLGGQIEDLDEQLDEAVANLEQLRLDRQAAERRRDEAQTALYQAHRQLSELSGQLQSQRGRWDVARQRSERLLQEQAQLQVQREELDAQIREARARLDESVGHMGDLEDQRHQLEQARRQLLETREEARMNARDINEQVHALALSLESRRTARAGLQQSVQRSEQQLEQVQARREALEAQLSQQGDPLAGLEAEQQAYLEQRLLADRQLVEARRVLDDCDGELRRLEQDRHRVEQTVSAQRERHAEQRLAAQALQLRAEQLAQAIAEAGLELEVLLTELPAEAETERWRQQLAELAVKIQRLEPVNLAAIQEYAEQSERRSYLENQLTDLAAALETLEGAIRKIDRETRALFKETFERVNAGVQLLFPRLFGGGHAYLELTGDDLLSTGVAIMARPPGKRVSNISLLSGGEKALTAVSLVFAIFGLNPAPFCLLDEVDAPLDEANVGRFSAMVREMSEKVQFIFVSHNKATMEAASQLCGVTMREPGVSRLVQVDLAEAAKLAGAA